MGGLFGLGICLMLGARMLSATRQYRPPLTFVDRVDPVRLTIQRGQELLEVQLTLEP